MVNTTTDQTTKNSSEFPRKNRSNLRKWLLWFVLIDFVIFSTWVMWDIGYIGIWEAGFESSGSLQILLDLSIGCFLISFWIIGDARARRVRAAPWVLATFAVGMIAPLTYLLAREYKKQKSTSLLGSNTHSV